MSANRTLRQAALYTTCALGVMTAGSAHAANWLMLQGTEPRDSAARAKVWGFVQAQWQKDFSDANPGPPGCAAATANCYVPPKLIGPNLDSQEAFNVNRARIGVRGTGFPLDSNINYFLLAEFGNNGITKPADAFAKLTDASVTFNHVKGARVRAGLFKYPGSEEGLQAIHVFDFINFSEVANGLLLERFPEDVYTPNVPAQPESGTSVNGFTKSVGAFRDTGIQVFDTFDMGNNWEVSYAAMIGNGNGLNFENPDDSYDTYLYVSGEKVFGGKGPRREGLKLFAWGQWGERELDDTNDGQQNPTKHDRNRLGVGAKYLKKPFRFSAEYVDAEGMIFVGPDKPTFIFGPSSAKDADGSGWYLDAGYYIPDTKWQIDARYSQATKLEDLQAEHTFKSLVLGANYHFNKKTRVTVNYEFRDYEAKNFSTSGCPAPACGPNNNLIGVDDRIGIQVTAIF